MKYKKALQISNRIILFSVPIYAVIAWIYGVIPFLFASVLGVMISMHIFFIIGTINKNHTIVDFAWGLSFVIVAHISFWMNFEFTLPRVLVLLMVTIWGLRLASHIHIRSH